MRRTTRQFKVLIERGEDGYFVARVPVLPGCMTQAKTYEELLRRAREAIALYLEVERSDRRRRRGRRMHRRSEPRFIGVEDLSMPV